MTHPQQTPNFPQLPIHSLPPQTYTTSSSPSLLRDGLDFDDVASRFEPTETEIDDRDPACDGVDQPVARIDVVV